MFIELGTELIGEYPVRHLRAGEILFREMDRKVFLYRVQSGALCFSNSQTNHSAAAVTFAFPGDLVGLGFLEHHTELALAVGDASIDCLPRNEQEKLAAINQRYRDQLDAATEKEFEHQRVRLTGAAAQSPIARVASYLLAVSTTNLREGLDPHIVEEPSAPAVSYLQITVDQLAHILSLFQTLELIKPEGSNRLNLKDLDSLRNIADANIGIASGRRSGRTYQTSEASAYRRGKIAEGRE